MTLGLQLAIRGDLEKYLKAKEQRLTGAVRDGVNAATDLGKRRLRMATRSAGLGGRLEKTWRGNVYPRRGKPTLQPAGLIFSKAPQIMRAFSEGKPIRSPSAGGFLAIPTEFAPRTGKGGKRGPMRMEEFLEEYGTDSLRVIPAAGGRRFYAIADKGFRRSRGKRAASRKTSKSKRARIGDEQLLMYVLVKQVRIGVRINISHIIAVLERQFPKLASERIGRALSEAA